MQQTNDNLKLELTNMKRNPYLANYSQERRTQGNKGGRQSLKAHPAGRQSPKAHPAGKQAVRVCRQKALLLLTGVICILLLLVIRGFLRHNTEEIPSSDEVQTAAPVSALPEEKIQGISETAYNQHPSREDILRHYDCGGKKCPLYYTEHEDAWEQLKKDVAASL